MTYAKPQREPKRYALEFGGLPLQVFVGRDTIGTAVFDAVFVLDNTQALCLKMMQAFGMKKPGQCCVEWVNRENDRRLREAATLAASKGARTHRRQAALAA